VRGELAVELGEQRPAEVAVGTSAHAAEATFAGANSDAGATGAATRYTAAATRRRGYSWRR
jgi:hypothetical protein